MAKAEAYCTCTKCGAKFIRIGYQTSVKAANEWKEWAEGYFDTCNDCYQAEKEEKENKKHQEMVDEYSLPDLSGTEKQIAWANKIRDEKIEGCVQFLSRLDTEAKTKENYVEVEQYTQRFESLKDQNTTARFWIDNRDIGAVHLLEKQVVVSPEEVACKKEEEEIRKSFVCLVEPEKVELPVIVSIRIDEEKNAVYLKNEKNDWLREFYHGRQYEWDGDKGMYVHKTEAFRGTAADHAAEMGSLLLKKGARVEFPNEEIKNKALSGDYTPENFRYICFLGTDGKVGIRWGNKYTYYGTMRDRAKRLPSAKDDKPYVVVSAKYYREIEDFAENYNFIISPGARRELDKVKSTVEIATPATGSHVEYNDRIDKMRNSSDDILDKLRDED